MYVIDRMDVDPRRCEVFRNGIPAEFLAMKPPAETAVGDRLRIAQVGTFIERKGIDYAVPAYIELLRARPHLEIGLIGTGVDEVAVVGRFPRDVRQRVRVVPRYEHETLPRLLSDYQILMLPSLAEGVPVCLAEAMACGLAPVVTAIPGPTEIVESDRNGLTVPVADTASIVAALGRLDDNRTLLHRLRVAAHRDAQSYGWDEVAAEQIRFYEEALALKRERRP
jgi:glycosyltransferase involved in cell wall biosynthesis